MDSFKLINDFLTFNGRLEKKPFIRRYLIVFFADLCTDDNRARHKHAASCSSIVRLCYSANVAGSKALPRYRSQLAENSSGSRRAYYSACFTRFPRFPLLGQKRPLPQPVRLI